MAWILPQSSKIEINDRLKVIMFYFLDTKKLVSVALKLCDAALRLHRDFKHPTDPNNILYLINKSLKIKTLFTVTQPVKIIL